MISCGCKVLSLAKGTKKMERTQLSVFLVVERYVVEDEKQVGGAQ